MLLEVSVETLKKLKITAHQFLVIKLIHDQRIDDLNAYLNVTESLSTLGQDLSILSSRGFLNYNATYPADFQHIKVSPLYSKAIAQGNLFEELLNTFPRKVFRPNGTIDYLRTDRERSEKLYRLITGNNRSKHDHILECLRFEINLRQKEGSLYYMKRLPSWLASKEWESYADRIVDTTGVLKEDKKYGTDVE